ncbi:MAG: hypothetical protein H0V46_08605 [Sphingomonas sp.]|nr:hypothetical protein [Sphingomonas sp.]
MDGYRQHPSEFVLPAAGQASAAVQASAAAQAAAPAAPAAEIPAPDDVAAAIGTDERRMHVRAYNYWVSLLDGRDYPSVEDLEPANISDFAANSVLLDFTAGHEDPAAQYIGTAIREECGLEEHVRSLADIPSRSLLSRLTDHYMQIIANRAPVGFEAEFVNHRGVSICYRGILMPFSSDGDTIDFIYGVINWKAAESRPRPESHPELGLEVPADGLPTIEAQVEAPDVEMMPDVADDENGGAEDHAAGEEPRPAFDLGAMPSQAGAIEIPEVRLDDDAGLADWLCAARETAEEVKDADGRSRAALYKALSRAHDFAIAAQRDPADYAELLEESGVKAQARAPMTPIVKLVFGIDYDKTRLTEFAAALSHAQRLEVPLGGFQALIDGRPGGLKALVAAERQARRPDAPGEDRAEAARERLRSAVAIDLHALPGDEEFCLVVTRRGADGVHRPVARVADPGALDRALRRIA